LSLVVFEKAAESFLADDLSGRWWTKRLASVSRHRIGKWNVAS
jgi:hypothetical protein